MFAIGLGWHEGGILILVLLVLFGAKRLPELGRSLGQGIKEFKRAGQGALLDDDDDKKSGESSVN